MSRFRRITLTLTEAQYLAICDAVASHDNELEQDFPEKHATRRALNAGWDSLRAAWEAKGRD